MADYITAIRTTTGDKKIDYKALANLPEIPSLSGCANTLSGTASGAIVKMDDVSPIEHTVGCKVESKNLIPYPYSHTTRTVNGITFTDNGDGSVTVKGTATGLAYFYLMNGTAFFGDVAINAMSSDNANNGSYTASKMLYYNPINHVLSINISSGSTVDETLYPQVEKGTEATAYVPFVDPTTVKVTKCGKNLAYPCMHKGNVGGYTYTPNEDGSLTISGAATTTSEHVIPLALKDVDGNAVGVTLKAGETYTLTVTKNGQAITGFGVKVILANGTAKWSFDKTATNDRELTLIYVQFTPAVGDTEHCGTYRVQLELNDTATTYEPYEGETYTPEADGTVSDMTALSPNMTILANAENVIVECEYNRDNSKAIENLSETVSNLAQYRLISDSSGYGRLTSNIAENGYYNVTAAMWDDLPVTDMGCVLLVFQYSPNYVIQIAFYQPTGIMYTRIVHKTNKTVFRDWVNPVESVAQYGGVLDSANYDRLTSHIVKDGYYSITTSLWDDFPLTGGGALLVMRYSPNYVVQMAVQITTGVTLTRIVNRNTFAIYRNWKTTDNADPLNILAIGDSICYGARNSKKGFVGDIGYPYKNAGVSGATISNKRTAVTNIPDQLIGVTGFTPDVIIADGGVNDYYYGAELGDIPTVPVTTDSAAEALNRNTVMGGLQYLFYKMIALYPKAQRFFLLTHKTTANLNGVMCDYTVTANAAGYTQTQLFDAIKAVCKLYGVKVIDIFGESMINTAFDVYKSDVAYSDDSTVTNTEFVDADGIHPLAYGYLHGYIPHVRRALALGTNK